MISPAVLLAATHSNMVASRVPKNTGSDVITMIKVVFAVGARVVL